LSYQIVCRMTSGAGLDCLRILSETVSSDSPRMPRLRHGIRPILFKCFKAFTISLQNGALWSLRRLMAQEADPPDPCQMLEILYKSFTKRSILEPRAPHGSRARARARARSPNPSPSLSPGPSQSPSPSPSPTPYIHINIAFTQMPPKA